MNPVVLRAPRADDDDRRGDPLGAGFLNHTPAVSFREHEIEYEDVRPFEPQPRETLLSLADHDGIEPGRRKMARHAVRDDGVILDDQDFGHTRRE